MRNVFAKPIPPIVVRSAAAVVLGVATTVAIAWSLALLVDGSMATVHPTDRGFRTDLARHVIPTPPESPQQEGTHFVQVVRRRRAGTEIVEVGPVWSEDPDAPAYESTHALVEGTSFAAEMKGKFNRREAATALWRADGWPLPVFSAEVWWASHSSNWVWKVVGGELVGSQSVPAGDGVRIVPLQPIWSGLVVNSLFYSSVWYAIFSLFWYRELRSTLRRRRGQCVRCGYKILNVQTRCSECGEQA